MHFASHYKKPTVNSMVSLFLLLLLPLLSVLNIKSFGKEVAMKGVLLSLLILLSFMVNADQEKITIGLSVWSGYPESVRGFKEALAEDGFVEGTNIEFIHRNALSNNESQKKIAKEFSDRNVDMVYSLTTPGTIIIKEELPTQTPVIFSIVTYPADSGLIESFNYSGNNLVGTSNFVPLQNYIELLSSVLPDAKTIAIFHRKGEPNSKIQASNLIRLYRKRGIKVFDFEPQSIDEAVQLAKSVIKDIDALVTTTDTLMQNGAELALIELSSQYNIPVLSSNKKGIEQGATFGPVADFYTLGRMSGAMAAQILKGKSEPHTLESKYQNPPTFLVNKLRFNKLGLSFSIPIDGVVYVE
jgi:putative ABC transport system substrate-binding protein